MFVARGSALAYGMALAVVAAAVGLRLLLEPWLGDRLPFITLFAGIALAAWKGGRGPALLALVVGAFAGAFFLLHPRYSFVIDQPEYQAGLIVYGVVGLALIAIFESLEREAAARRAAEQVLAQREEFLRVTLASIGDAVMTTDAKGNIVYLNGVAQELTGWTPEEAHGQALSAVFRIINMDTRQSVENPVDKALREGRAVGLANHTVLIGKDGTERPIDDSAAPIRDEKGHIHGVVLIFRDITERHQAEAELQRSEAQFRATFEQAAVGIAQVGLDGRWLRVNGKLCDILGFSRDEMVGRTFQDFTHPDVLSADLTEVGRLLAGEINTYSMEKRYLRKDGALIWAELTVSLFRATGGQPAHFISVVSDITQRKRAADLLQQSEARFRAAIDAVSSIVWTNDVHGKMTGEQVGWGNFTGQDRESYQGYGWANAVHPDDAQPTIDAWNDAVTHKRTFVFEHRVRRHDGQWRLCSIRAVPLLDATGEITEWVGVHADITERRQVEERLRQNESRFSVALQNSRILVYTTDDELRYTWIRNPHPGYHPEQVLGRRDDELLPPEQAEPLISLKRAVLESGIGRRQEFDVVLQGQRHVYDLTVEPLRDAGGSVVGLAVAAMEITERKQAVEQLQASEEKYRTLFTKMDEGFCVVEMAFDPAGQAIDYHIEVMNPAFEKHTGMAGLVGKSIRQAIPDLEAFWYDTYGRVATTGEPTRFVHQAGPMDGRWFDVHAFRLGVAGTNRVAILFNDITARTQAEETIRASEARHSFAVALSDTIRPLSDSTAVQAAASRLLGERLGANRVAYFEVLHEDYRVERDYTDAVPSIVGRYPIALFGPEMLAAYRAGRTVSESDVHALPSRQPDEKEAFAALDIRAYLSVPLVKGGEFVAGLAIHAATPRAWTAAEIAMVEDTAERTWAAVERVRAEAEAARLVAEAEGERRLFDTALSNTADFNFIFTLDGRCVYANRPLLAEWGRSAADAVGRSMAELGYPPDVEAQLLGDIRRVAQTKQMVRADTGYPSRNVETAHYEYALAPVLGADGTVVQVVGSARDMRDRRRTEEELRRTVEEFQTLMDTLPVGVFVAHDPLCSSITGNAAAHALLRTPAPNLSKSAPAGQAPLHFRVYRNGAEIPTDQLPVQRAARGELVQNEEVDDVFDDGTVLHTLMSAAPLYDGQGRVRGAVATVLDVTERKRVLEALKDADRRKDDFLATLAHELRNPLAPVTNSLELIKLAKGNGELIDRARGTMERQLGQMVRLIDDLLDVSRITRDKLELKKERVELATVLHHVVEACRPLAERAGHELLVALPTQPIYLNADPVRLAQVVGNLLTNSCKYTEPGGQIWLSAERQGNDVAVIVRDSGIGIPSDMLDKVFDLFTQVDRSLGRSEGGLGIGLSLVKRLVELHDGTVTALSEGPGLGSEFVVRLPALGATMAPEPSQRSEQPSLKARRILVVDDNQDSAESLALLLSLSGNETQTAHDGVEAVEKAAAFRPDVILLDIGLPKMSGHAACLAIREQPWGKDIVMIALTGWGQEDDRRKSQQAGFDSHLVKPVDHSVLMQLLASATPASESQATKG